MLHAVTKPTIKAFQCTIFGILFCLLPACSQNASGKSRSDAASKPAVPVTVSTAVQKNVPVQLRAIGRVQAYSTVTIKAQVSGELIGVHFKEGQDVKKDDMLFTIDPQPFETQLKQAEANLARDRAQQENARKQVARYGSVVTKGYVSQEQYDALAANESALNATVRADEAAVENARISLKYCYIRSPINGCAGELKVNAGNVIKSNDEEKPLVTINQISPVYVTFAVPEQNLTDIKKYMAEGKLSVFAAIPGQEHSPVTGQLTFLDNAVDFSTGTIQLKAEFTNGQRELWPGQFANVTVTLSEQKDAVVIPFEAVQTGQQGEYAFVLKPDSTVEYRLVSAGRIIQNEIIINKGIAPGESVVTDGQLRLANGSKVKVVEKNASED